MGHRRTLLALLALCALSTTVDAISHGKDASKLKTAKASKAAEAVPSYSFVERLHFGVAGLEVLFMLLCLVAIDARAVSRKYVRCLGALGLVCAIEWAAHSMAPLPHVSASVMILVAVLFTINPVEEAGRMVGLHMGTVPLVCVLWLCVVGVLSQADLVKALYGTESLRPYHVVVTEEF